MSSCSPPQTQYEKHTVPGVLIFCPMSACGCYLLRRYDAGAEFMDLQTKWATIHQSFGLLVAYGKTIQPPAAVAVDSYEEEIMHIVKTESYVRFMLETLGAEINVPDATKEDVTYGKWETESLKKLKENIHRHLSFLLSERRSVHVPQFTPCETDKDEQHWTETFETQLKKESDVLRSELDIADIRIEFQDM